MYLIATVGRDFRPGKVIKKTENKEIAIKTAKEYANKWKTRVGVWEYTKYKWYGMIRSF